MKKVVSLIVILAILSACTCLIACSGGGGITWNDIPVYPEAELEITRNWSEFPEEEPWIEVEWRYYLAADKYSVGQVTSFYESEMPTRGWQEASELGASGIEGILWSYGAKINLYIPPDIVGRLSEWGFYSKNNEQDWAAVWMGINKDWEKADKTFIVIMIAR